MWSDAFLGMTISVTKGGRPVNTELKNAVKATDSKAQYDTSAKRLLGQKSILAHILVKTVDEFKGMNPKNVVDCIEGTPHISTVPVEPGLTNAASEKMVSDWSVSTQKMKRSMKDW